ncbi:MAG: metal-dependent hydrolase, partial [Candidatus Margulisiibacteriota bacterium]
MIFSHAPLGFITTYLTSKIWKIKLTKKQNVWFFIIGILLAIFPDLDLFYYYFISASETHRVLITHTPFLYLLFFLLVFLIGYLFKKRFIKLIAFIILLTSFSHLLLDSLGSGIAWLYPSNGLPYGLLSFSTLNNGFYGQNFFAINYSLEILIFTIFLNLLFFIKFKKIKPILAVITFSLTVALIFILFYINQHMFSINSDNYYGDKDFDSIMNMKDLDMDGDGIANIEDIDANNNGQKNIDDLIETANKVEGVYYDKTEEGLYGLFSRFGF